MSGIDIFAWLVFVITIAVGALIFVILGMLPGKVAQQRQHPQAQAIQVASWVFLILGFAIWPFVLVWAYMRPIARPSDAEALEGVSIADLEMRIAQLEAASQGGAKA